MNNADYGLDYIHTMLAKKGFIGNLEDVDSIIQKIHTMTAFKSFIFGIHSYFYTSPKEVHESILQVKSIDNGFNESKHIEFVNKITSEVNKHLMLCDTAEFFDSDGYFDIVICYDNKSVTFSVDQYSGNVKVSTLDNGLSKEDIYKL